MSWITRRIWSASIHQRWEDRVAGTRPTLDRHTYQPSESAQWHRVVPATQTDFLCEPAAHLSCTCFRVDESELSCCTLIRVWSNGYSALLQIGQTTVSIKSYYGNHQQFAWHECAIIRDSDESPYLRLKRLLVWPTQKKRGSWTSLCM